MAPIVGVHGIAQQLKAADLLDAEWWPSLKGGVSNAKRPSIPDGSLRSAFYGSLFRTAATIRAGGDVQYRPSDVEEGFEQELLRQWWVSAASTDPSRVVPPDAQVRGTPSSVQAALRALSRSKFFTGIAEYVMIGDLKQVRLYLSSPTIRDAAQRSVNDVVTEDTRVIVAHSLGTVVTFEALHRYESEPNWKNVRSLVTLGSPLGIRNLIFAKLNAAPVSNKGKWPRLLERWTNLCADNDLVALEKKLGPLFDDRIVDMRIDNEARAHDVSPYLTDGATGNVIADAIA